jgi:hypothetical protein
MNTAQEFLGAGLLLVFCLLVRDALMGAVNWLKRKYG